MLRAAALLVLVLPLALFCACANGDLSSAELGRCPNWPNPSGAVVPVRTVEPYYPRSALRERVQGHVDIAATIGRDGRVESAKVIRSVPPGVFDEAALSAFRDWRYCPLPAEAPAYPDPVKLRLQFAL